MQEDPLEAVNSFVERAYVRMQAGEVLLYCLEREDTAPMRTLVEGLVLEGTQSLNTLREVQAEVGLRRSQLQDDLHQIFSDLVQKFIPYGLNAISLVALLLEGSIEDEADQANCLQALRNSQDMVANFIQHLRLIDEMETHLNDWLWGLIYQSTQQEWSGQPGPVFQKQHPL
jgi:hypothetical protein